VSQGGTSPDPRASWIYEDDPLYDAPARPPPYPQRHFLIGIVTKNRLLCLVLGVPILISILGIALWVDLTRDLPTPEHWLNSAVPPATTILDRRGRLLYEITDPRTGRQRPVALADVPDSLRRATVATEDATFYTNPGVDVRSIVRALWINLRGGQVLSGGSTITQQLARNLLLEPGERFEQTLRRKLRESILAYGLATRYSKDTILETYLNYVYYGNIAYGVQAAARTYFGKAVQELDLAECALLAGLPQAPALYNPLIDPESASRRQATVLDLMVRNGDIDADIALAAKEEPLQYAASPFPIRAPHFVMYVWEELRRRFGEEALFRQGLTVTTALDVDLYDRTRELARHHLRQLAAAVPTEPNHNVSGAAVVILDADTGDILSMLGSPDYFAEAIDGAVNVALMPRQPGSAIKPLTYAAAFEQGFGPASMFLDVPTTFVTAEGTAYAPVNYDQRFRGPVLLRDALGSSLNVIAVRLLDAIGVPRLVDMAQRLGLTTLYDPQRYGLALTLGGGEVRLLELTAAYAAFASGGFRVEPRAVLRVESPDGQVLWQAPSGRTQQVLSPDVVFLVTDILSDNLARIPAFGESSVLRLARPAAVKTGTTSDWRDNWTIGYTPQTVVGVWVGNANNAPMVDVSGIDGAAPIWHDAMEETLQSLPVRHFEPPDTLTRIEVCATSGMLPNSLCPNRRLEWFPVGQTPQSQCSVHRLVEIDVRSGRPATDDTPSDYREPQPALVLPADASPWAYEQAQRTDMLIVTGLGDEPEGSASHGVTCIRLASPQVNDTYRLSSQIPAVQQRIAVSALPTSLANLTVVEVIVDGTTVARFRQPPFNILWQLTPGQHTFQAVAEYADGRSCQSDAVTVTVIAP